MVNLPNKKTTTERARRLRAHQTKSERLLWSVLRGRQLSGLKFRRQHPIGPFYADFACPSKKLVVEVDGGYHDLVAEDDEERESYLKEHGWIVVRLSDTDVEQDVEAAAIGIAKELDVIYEFSHRKGTRSGFLKKRSGE